MAWHIYSEGDVVYNMPPLASKPPPRDAIYSGDGVWAEVHNKGRVVQVFLWMNEYKDGALVRRKVPKGVK